MGGPDEASVRGRRSAVQPLWRPPPDRREYGRALVLSESERVIPPAPTVARLLPRDGGEPIAALWRVVATRDAQSHETVPTMPKVVVEESRNRTGTRCSPEWNQQMVT